MITRLRVHGFKNLVRADLRFGPFTVIAGANGVGKSNVFDALTFLSELASGTISDAAAHVRDPGGTSDLRSLFTRSGATVADEMRFDVDMIVPRTAEDDLNQPAKASITFLRYGLTLGFEPGDNATSSDRLVVRREELRHINRGKGITQTLPFPHSRRWRESVLSGRSTSPFFSTEKRADGQRIVKRHQDGNAGRPQLFAADKLPRTLLSSANAQESPTALVARREMQAWRLLHFEPTALRRPDDFLSPSRLAADGSHLAATLYRLARTDPHGERAVYTRVANRLADLLGDVSQLRVDRDERRELLTLTLTDASGTPHSARSLSDGTLRFLALSVIEEDPAIGGVWCLEEPENGLFPDRIPLILDLLRDIATSTQEPVEEEEPLRQVVVNTHSPSIVEITTENELIVARPARTSLREGDSVRTVRFEAPEGSWRTKPGDGQLSAVPKGFLLTLLRPISPDAASGDGASGETLVAEGLQLDLWSKP